MVWYARFRCGEFALQQEADCIIGIGARFDDRTTGILTKYAPNAKKIIHVDIDNTMFDKTIERILILLWIVVILLKVFIKDLKILFHLLNG